MVVIAAIAAGLYWLLAIRPDSDSELSETEQETAISGFDEPFTDNSHGFTDVSDLADMNQYPLDYDESEYSHEFKLADINLADSYETVLQTYGQPLSRRTSSETSIHNPDYICYWTYWDYDGLEVLFMKVEEDGKKLAEDIGGVFALKVVSEDYATQRGIKVGDPVSQVLEQYNQEYEGACFSEDTNELFFEDGLNCLRFSVKDDHISEILTSQILN